jgi:hypothetical protein
MKYLRDRSLAVAAQPGVRLRSDLLAWPASRRIYRLYVAHPCSAISLTETKSDDRLLQGGCANDYSD